MNIRRIHLAPMQPYDNSGIKPLYPIDEASWIWHPKAGVDEPVFLIFERSFSVSPSTTTAIIHCSADQRYELYCDDQRIAKGPDRGWIRHWTFSSFELTLEPGEHVLRCEAWNLGDRGPEALVSWRGGFILKGEADFDKQLTTGKAPWRVTAREGWHMNAVSGLSYHVIGHEQTVDGAEWNKVPKQWVNPVEVRGPVDNCPTGIVQPGWRLFPSMLPDLIDRDHTPGRFVAKREGLTDAAFTASEITHPDLSILNAKLQDQQPITIHPGEECTLIWDLEEYYCGFPEMILSGGKNAKIEWKWAESLYEPGDPLKHKGDRNRVVGKHFVGFGHTFIADGSDEQHFRAYWWTSGRYCRLRITTQDAPLTLCRLTVNETRYPLLDEGSFAGGDARLDLVRKLGVRALRMCAHDTYMDCPYYEQMMYAGDTRIELLTTYMLTRDTRLPKRSIELFDQSREFWGFTTERCTSRNLQLSPTFSLIWCWMVHDYLYWRGDTEWVLQRMCGVRASLESFLPHLTPEMLLKNLPGWCFVDWVSEGWTLGAPSGAVGGISAIPNLQYVLALQKTADVERQVGDQRRAVWYEHHASEVGRAILATFWDNRRGLLKDDPEGTTYSQHAQCLLLLSRLLPSKQEQRLFNTLLKSQDLLPTSVYFRFYLFEVFAQFNRTDLIVDSLDFWAEMNARGMKTTIEEPEPSRSDCHAWGAHPIVHMYASLLGLRPTSPGMKTVSIRPQPAGLPYLRGSLPTPMGLILFNLDFGDGHMSGWIELPPGITGDLVWKTKTMTCTGKTTIAR